MSELLHDFRVWLWGCLNEHPDVKESKFCVLPPVEWKTWRGITNYCVEVRFRRPKVLLLNTLEMEDDYLQRGLNS